MCFTLPLREEHPKKYDVCREPDEKQNRSHAGAATCICLFPNETFKVNRRFLARGTKSGAALRLSKRLCYMTHTYSMST